MSVQTKKHNCACHSDDALECARARYGDTNEQCDCVCHDDACDCSQENSMVGEQTEAERLMGKYRAVIKGILAALEIIRDIKDATGLFPEVCIDSHKFCIESILGSYIDQGSIDEFIVDTDLTKEEFLTTLIETCEVEMAWALGKIAYAVDKNPEWKDRVSGDADMNVAKEVYCG
jgi:hypothetical protein